MRVVDLYPLTPLQQGILFHSIDGASYVEQVSARLHGVDVDRMRGAWHAVAAAHPVFRTAFSWRSHDEPMQAVVDEIDVPFEVVATTEVDRFLLADRQRGLDLDRAPAMRVTLLDLGDGAHQLVWTYHHLLLDGWSTTTVLEDLSRAYAGRQLIDRPSFSTYVRWLRDQPFDRDHWTAELGDVEAATPLPFGARSTGPAAHAVHAWELDERGSSALVELARRLRVTASSVLECAWALVLARHADVDDVVFGTTVAGRSPGLEGIDDIVGLVMNTLAVRVQIDPGRTASSWIRTHFQRSIGRHGREQASLVEVQRCTRVRPPAPLCSTLFAYESYPGSDRKGSQIAGLPTSEVRVIEQGNVPLTFAAIPGDRLRFGLTYDTATFSATQVAQLASSIDAVIRSVIDKPEGRVGQISLDPSPDPRLRGSEPAPSADAAPCVHEAFEAQVDATPDAIAARCRDDALTYRELDELANATAATLQARGVGRSSVVGVCFERSTDHVVAVLAALKAGACFLPLDPRDPAPRRALVLADADAAVVIDRIDRSARSAERPPRSAHADDPAYVIFTSGSTGRPKGVIVEHRAITGRLADPSLVDAGPGDVFLGTAPTTFDVSVYEVLGPLRRGATLELCPEELLDVAGLRSLVQQRGVTHLWLSAALLRVVVDEDPAALRGPRWLICGGEAIPPAAATSFLEHGDGAQLINGYGPTEVSVFSVTCPLVPSLISADGVPIGRPVAGTHALVLDRHLTAVPPGIVGELHLGGIGVGRGYLGRPGLTAERFIPDPSVTGGRMYRTGDLVRVRDDGLLDFVGRADGQVKVRGHRVELGEVEAAIEALEGVASALATKRDDRLVAYVVATPGMTVSPAEIERSLRNVLPSFMVPSAVVPVAAWPLTSNGKVDRAALPDPTAAPAASPSPAPEDALEAALAAIWAEVLGLETVACDVDLFDLGGDSISAMRITARIRRHLSVDLGIREVLESPSVRSIAPTIAAHLAGVSAP
jgi:amino acid adenylation domain-containing protein